MSFVMWTRDWEGKFHFSEAQPEKCPECGNATVLKVMYNLPSPVLFEAAKYGKIAFGGCCTDKLNPAWICGNCEAPIYQL